MISELEGCMFAVCKLECTRFFIHVFALYLCGSDLGDVLVVFDLSGFTFMYLVRTSI